MDKSVWTLPRSPLWPTGPCLSRKRICSPLLDFAIITIVLFKTSHTSLVLCTILLATSLTYGRTPNKQPSIDSRPASLQNPHSLFPKRKVLGVSNVMPVITQLEESFHNNTMTT